MNIISKIEKGVFEKHKKEKFDLSIEEVMDNICTDDGEIISKLYDLTLSLLDVESKRTTSLDSKAANILGMAGVALALIFSLGGLLLEKIKDVTIFYMSTTYALSILYIFTNIVLLLSIIFAVVSIRARSDYKTVTDKDIFTKEIDQGENYYKRYMIVHLRLLDQALGVLVPAQ
ncbi:MAG: hypothetical protein V3W31_10510 [Thermodesulfobacteriota bacterium]